MPTSAAPIRCVAIKMAVEDSGLLQKGWKIDGPQRRSSEQAGRRRQHRPAVDRQRQGRCHRRYAEFRRRTGGRAISSREERGAAQLGRRHRRSDRHRRARRTRSPSTYDTYMLANGTGKALTKAGGDSWFFLTADYAFGHALRARYQRGGRPPTAARCWAGSSIRSTPSTSRRSCCRRRPRRPRSSASPMPAATPPTRSSRRPNSASSAGGQKLAALLLFINDVHSLGLKTAQGLSFTGILLLGHERRRRAHGRSASWRCRQKSAMPSMTVAGNYAARAALSQGHGSARRQPA